jgi:hypothetical protein
LRNKKSVNICTFTFNDSLYISNFIEWYTARFSNLKIHVYDNYSTDDTVEKALKAGCQVTYFGDSGQYSIGIDKFAELRELCFMRSSSDYVLICDIDEFLDVCDKDLMVFNPVIVQGIGYHMLGNDSTEFKSIRLGVSDALYDKCLMFRRSKIAQINFGPGAHSCAPKFLQPYQMSSNLRRPMYHFRWLSLNHVIERYKRNAKRISPADRSAGYAFQYFQSRKMIEKDYSVLLNNAEKLEFDWQVPDKHTFSCWGRLLKRFVNTGKNQSELKI